MRRLDGDLATGCTGSPLQGSTVLDPPNFLAGRIDHAI